MLRPYLTAPADGATLVLQHAGGAKGKALLDAARKAGALEVGCAKLTRLDERCDFVRAEVRAAGGTIGADAVAGLVDAVGSDLRELAAVSAQLVSDCGGKITIDVVREYHTGRAEVSGFAVSDQAMLGSVADALETLRFALAVGVPHVVIADAMADGVRTVARVAAATRGSGRGGNEYALAATLKMPPWKVKRAMSQARGLERARGCSGPWPSSPGSMPTSRALPPMRPTPWSARFASWRLRTASPDGWPSRPDRVRATRRKPARPSRPPTAAAEEAAQTAESPRPHRSSASRAEPPRRVNGESCREGSYS